MKTNEPRFWAIALMGPIAAGKGTQADLLAMELGLVHLENSKIIEKKFADEPNSPIVQKAREDYMAGRWIDPQILMKWIGGVIQDIADKKLGIVMSGGFRTDYETEAELDLLEKSYDKKNIKFIEITLSEQEAIKRSLGRRICRANRHPIPNFPEFKDLKTCPQDGSELVTRVLDKPELISRRFQEYLTRTVPSFDIIKKQGYDIVQINGEQPIENVHREILNNLW
jgi:adenylate kinase family enzyme